MKGDDQDLNANSTKRSEDLKGPGGIDSRNNNYNSDVDQTTSEDVKNANAAGTGAMGRNDERLTESTSNHSADD